MGSRVIVRSARVERLMLSARKNSLFAWRFEALLRGICALGVFTFFVACSILPGSGEDLLLISKSKRMPPEWFSQNMADFYLRDKNYFYIYETSAEGELTDLLKLGEASGKNYLLETLKIKISTASIQEKELEKYLREFAAKSLRIEDIYFETWQKSDLFSGSLLHRIYFLFAFAKDDFEKLSNAMKYQGEL